MSGSFDSTRTLAPALAPSTGSGGATRTDAKLRGPWLQVGTIQSFEWNRIDVPIAQLPPALHGLRIVHLTDTHITRRWWPAYDGLIARLEEDPPDLVLITGDFVDNRIDHRPALPVLERFVKGLRARIGVYGIVGNHDGDLLGPRLQGWGVHVLDNRFVVLESHDASIELIGIHGVKRRSMDVAMLHNLPPRRAGVPRIALAHYPDQAPFISKTAHPDLMLAGHTHGGQICLPGGRALLSHDRLPKSMASGAHRVGEILLVVSRGLGWGRWPVRVFCPAEVIELRLVARDESGHGHQR